MLLVFTSLFKLFHSIGVRCSKLAFPCFMVLTLGKLSLGERWETGWEGGKSVGGGERGWERRGDGMGEGVGGEMGSEA